MANKSVDPHHDYYAFIVAVSFTNRTVRPEIQEFHLAGEQNQVYLPYYFRISTGYLAGPGHSISHNFIYRFVVRGTGAF